MVISIIGGDGVSGFENEKIKCTLLGQVTTYCEQVMTGAKLCAQIMFQDKYLSFIKNTAKQEGCKVIVADGEQSFKIAFIYKYGFVKLIIEELLIKKNDGVTSTAFDIWATGKLFGYSDYLNLIKEQAPKLNFDIIKVPQISSSLKEVNYANYWLETVSKKTKHPHEAWAFVLHATEAQNAKTFVERAKRPTVHRSLIQFQLEDFDLAPFASSVLTAKTWYQGKKYSLVKEAFREMTENVLSGQKTIQEAIQYCVQRVNLTN